MNYDYKWMCVSKCIRGEEERGRGKERTADYYITSIVLTEGNHRNSPKLRAPRVQNSDIRVEGVTGKCKHS